MLLMQLTNAGWGAVGLVLFSIAITYGIVNRVSDSNSKAKGCISYAYVFAIVFSISSFAISIPTMVLGKLSIYLTGEKCTATIIDYTTYDSEDSEGGRTTMHSAIYKFKDKYGNFITKDADVGTGDIPVVGSKVIVYYDNSRGKEGVIATFTFSTILLLIVSLFIGFLMCLLLYAMIMYATNRSTKGIISLLIKIVIYIIVPAGMLFLGGGMAWYCYMRITSGYKSDQPIWVLIIAIFFSFTLFLAFIGYVKSLLTSKVESQIHF